MKSFKNMTISKKIWFLSCLLLAVIGVMGVTSYSNVHKLLGDIDYMDHEGIKVLKNMILADMMHDGIRANTFGAIIYSGSKDKKMIEDLKAEHEEFTKNIQEYIKNVTELSQTEEVDKLVAESKTELEEYVKSSNEMFTLAMNGDAEKAMSKLDFFIEKFENLEKKFAALDEVVEKEVENKGDASALFATKANWLSGVLVFVSLIIGTLFAFVTIRNLKMSLSEIISKLSGQYEEVNKNATQLTAASKEISRGSEQQASALQETAAAIDEITAMSKKTSENSGNLRNSAQTSLDSANKGSETISVMLKSMDDINNANNKTLKQIEESNNKIGEIVAMITEIGNKTKVINDIVFQTKLLSFNASVEAARAGEHGKGFAVVAEEVGNLAQMSGNAAKEISDMLSNSISKVNTIVEENKRMASQMIAEGKQKVQTGTQVAKQCGEALEHIVTNVTEVNRLITEIDSAISEQSTGVHEISKAVGMLDKTTHENAVISKQTSSNAEGMLGQAKSLGDLIKVMQSMNGQSETKSNFHYDTNWSEKPKSEPKSESTETHVEKKSYESNSSDKKKVLFEHKEVKNNVVTFPEKKNDDVKSVQSEVKLAAGAENQVPNSSDTRFEEF